MRLVKHKIKNIDYLYLQHSFRKDGKVVTREKYLGLTIPNDIERIKQEFRSEIQPEYYQQLEKIKTSFQKDWGKLPLSIREQQKEEVAITFTYNTNAIEGSTISEAEVRAIVLDKESPAKSLRDIHEAEAHNDTFLAMLESFRPITNKLLFKWHKDIFNRSKPAIAGKYREYNVRVGSYFPPEHHEVKKLMNQLVRFINSEVGTLNPVELAAIVHYRFEKIHPFSDGNGRIGRLLMNHILWFSGYPILVVEYSRRQQYYRALQRNEDGFISYFVRRYKAVHQS